MFSKFASLTLVKLNISMNLSSTRICWLLEFAKSLVPQLSQLPSIALTPSLSLPPMHLYLYNKKILRVNYKVSPYFLYHISIWSLIFQLCQFGL